MVDFSPEVFLGDLSQQNWASVEESTDVNVALDEFIRIVSEAVEKHAPLKKVTLPGRKQTPLPDFNEDLQGTTQ